ncbi:MAG: hypothetical protein KatS3mg110_3763 [Pirellulaceae bacterium]|nr:MAG: hypothetical protein KatS3mg110_3763 [Pirellulaceae bacterium]
MTYNCRCVGYYILSHVVVVILWLGLYPYIGLGQNTVDRELDALAAATDTWLTNLEFYCTFEQYTATAATWDDARAGKYLRPPERVFEGIWAVSKECIRHAAHPTASDSKPPAGNSKTSSEGFRPLSVQDPTHDAARNRKTNVRLVWRPGKVLFSWWNGAAGSFFDRLALGPPPAVRSATKTGTPSGAQQQSISLPMGSWRAPDVALVADFMSSLSIVTPVYVWGNPAVSNLIRHFRELERLGVPVQWEVVRPDHASWEVHIDFGSDRRTVVKYVLASGFPTISEVAMYRTGDQKDKPLELRCLDLFENLVPVTGGSLATQVRSMIPTVDGIILVSIWRARDVRAPRAEDFIIRVPQRDRIWCVRSSSIPPAISGYRSFNIAEMSSDDFSAECQQTLAAKAAPPSSGWWPWFVALTVAATVMAWGLLRWRKLSVRRTI